VVRAWSIGIITSDWLEERNSQDFKRDAMELWEILVPTLMGKTNKPVRTKHHKQWDKYVRKLSNGLTILHPVKGQWVELESNELFEERMIPVRIACSEQDMNKIIQFTLTHYKQLAVMAYQLSNKVLIVKI